LKLHIQDKEIGQDFNYYAIPLPRNIQHYAAVDVLMTRLVTEKLLTLTSDTDFTVHGAPDDLRIGSVVQIWRGAGRRFVMKGTVKFIGAEGRTAESRYWGVKCVGKGRAVVKIDEVLIANVKPPFYYVSASDPSDSWDKDTTIGSLFEQCAQLNKELEIMVRTCNLFVTVSPIFMPQTASQLISTCKPSEGHKQPAQFISSASNEDLAAQNPANLNNNTNQSREKK
jgi:hypothetical protein